MSSSGPSESTSPPPELRNQFWLIVGALNVALLATALGLLVLALWSRPAMGVGLVAVGVAAGVFGVLRYRRVRANLSESE